MTYASSTADSVAPVRARVFGFLAWSAGFQLLLILSTWRLWFPDSMDLFPGSSTGPVDGSFPKVGLVGLAGSVPVGLDLSVAVIWVTSLLTQAVSAGYLSCRGPEPAPRSDRFDRALFWSLIVSVLAWVALVFVNQHRLQAWAYLAMWIQVLYLVNSASTRTSALVAAGALPRWRWLILSVYFYSAISKFDLTFLKTLGSQFLTTAWNGISGANLGLETVWPMWMTMLFPVGELIVAVGLAAGFARRWFVLVAMILHVGLLWLLGPWGMQHQAGVLLWNVFFVGQVWFLFWPVRVPENNADCRESWLARLTLYFVLLIPLAQNWGWCDSWLAWELYAPRGSRIQVFVAEPAIEALPELQGYVQRDSSAEFGPIWRELQIDHWSLDQLRAPIYPQDRFQLGVALVVVERVVEPGQVLVRWSGPADRWSGQREQLVLRSQDEMEQFGRRYFWNFRATKK